MKTIETHNADEMTKFHPHASRRVIHIAVVEDDPLFREAVKYYLEQEPGYKVSCYDRGETFLSEIWNMDFDLVILDHQLEESFELSRLNGLDVVKELKRIQYDIRVIIISAQDLPLVAAELIRHGASEYIVKDFNAIKHIQKSVYQTGSSIRKNIKIRRNALLSFASISVFFILFFAQGKIHMMGDRLWWVFQLMMLLALISSLFSISRFFQFRRKLIVSEF